MTEGKNISRPEIKEVLHLTLHPLVGKEIETSAVFSVLLFLMQGLTPRDEVADKALSKLELQMV